MTKIRNFGCFCMAGNLVGVVAFPSLRNFLPNGFRVACPSGGEGCSEGDVFAGEPESVCNGIGHRTCAGATLPLNPFGVAMLQHNHTWTVALCEEDSDGDGVTNGEELGDPCCLWEAYDTPSVYMDTFAATHPGVANSDVSGYARPADCSTTAPIAKASKMNYFNSWEEQRSAEVFIDNFAISSERTTYVDIALNFPDESMDLFHVVFAEAIVKNAKNLHHYVVNGCSEKWPADKVGKGISSEEASACRTPFGGWAPGQDIVGTPSWLGVPVGSSVGIVAFTVNVHFDNPTNEEGRVSNDGMRFYYTPDIREETLTTFPFMQVSLNPTMGIPPGKTRNFMTRSCTVKVEDDEGKPAAFKVSGINYHAHLLGREMYAELAKSGETETIDLGSERIWYFDDQYTKNLISSNFTLQTGDHVQATCIFDSTERTKTTLIGVETTDEMCWAGLKGWPGNIRVSCEGSIWTGELDATESGLGLALRYPESAAANVWDGTALRSGGALLKGGTVGVCYDAIPIQEQCDMLVMMIEDMGEGACSMDLGEMNARMKGRTITGICCTKACSSALCANEVACTTSSPTSNPTPAPTSSPTSSPMTDDVSIPPVSNTPTSNASANASASVSGTNAGVEADADVETNGCHIVIAPPMMLMMSMSLAWS